MDVLAIIPARGDSKRIHKKNIVEINGKPLIYYTIKSAQNAKLINKVIVSTDDEEIALVSKKYGAEIIMRPKDLATDDSTSEDALIHTIQEMKKVGYVPDATMLLQCTSPIRDSATIDNAIKIMIDTNCDSVISVTENQHYYLSGSLNEENNKFTPDYKKRPFSHKMPKKYKENGAIYITKTDLLLKHHNRIVGDVRAIPLDIIHSIDIDEQEDLELVRQLKSFLDE